MSEGASRNGRLHVAGRFRCRRGATAFLVVEVEPNHIGWRFGSQSQELPIFLSIDDDRSNPMWFAGRASAGAEGECSPRQEPIYPDLTKSAARFSSRA
jgi:hypothetical protein